MCRRQNRSDHHGGALPRSIHADSFVRVLQPPALLPRLCQQCGEAEAHEGRVIRHDAPAGAGVGDEQLVGRKVIQPVHEKLSAPAKATKTHRPAHEVLAEHMQKMKFAEFIVVLPEALAEAPDCVFEHDGTLDRYLTGLTAFAKLKADPANALKPDDFLATQAGLSHFGADLGERAKIRDAADYTATYKGVSRLFPLHVTLGYGLNPRTCMSIYFDWDPEARKLILARFGRHGRGA